MRRLGLLAAAIVAPALVWPASSFAQSMLGNAQGDQGTVVVPPAPPIVPSPPVAPVPDTPDQSQAAPVQATPLPPLPTPAAPLPQVIQDTQAPGLVQTPVPPANADNGQDQSAPTAPPAATGQTAPAAGQPSTGQPGAPATPDTADSTPPPIPNDWVQEKTAEIGILDKVGGGASTVTVPVGGQTVAGDLQISVLACVARPPNEVPDDAVFLNIQPTDDAGGAPIFRGWMIRSVPGATVVGNASETLRVVSCT
jgi:hypothetical protein